MKPPSHPLDRPALPITGTANRSHPALPSAKRDTPNIDLSWLSIPRPPIPGKTRWSIAP